MDAPLPEVPSHVKNTVQPLDRNALEKSRRGIIDIVDGVLVRTFQLLFLRGNKKSLAVTSTYVLYGGCGNVSVRQWARKTVVIKEECTGALL